MKNELILFDSIMASSHSVYNLCPSCGCEMCFPQDIIESEEDTRLIFYCNSCETGWDLVLAYKKG
jgi:hypothetical protein